MICVPACIINVLEKLLEESVTTYQELLGSYWKKMLHRIRNVLEEDVTTYQELLG